MKHILFINDQPFNPKYGGIERVTDSIARGLVARGYQVSYLFGRVGDKALLDYDFPATLYELPQAGMFTSEENRAYYERLLTEQKVDIVVNQRGLNSYMNPALDIRNVKRVSVVHSKPTAYADYKVWRLLYRKPGVANLIKYALRRLLYPLVRRSTARRHYGAARRQMAHIVQHSEAVVMLCNRYVEDVHRLGVVPSEGDARLLAINNPNSFSSTCSTTHKEREVLFVGRVDAVEKNTPRLVEVWQRIYADFPDWRLVIVGDGPAMGQIKEYISQHNTERVSLEGFQSNVQRYYERAAIVCLTSNFEGWPLAMIEGMQCGCVPFAFNTFGAAEEIIDHEQCGMVIEPDNIEQYAARLAEVMSDEPRRTAMAAAASEKSRRWSCDAIVEQWVALFESL